MMCTFAYTQDLGFSTEMWYIFCILALLLGIAFKGRCSAVRYIVRYGALAIFGSLCLTYIANLDSVGVYRDDERIIHIGHIIVEIESCLLCNQKYYQLQDLSSCDVWCHEMH